MADSRAALVALAAAAIACGPVSATSVIDDAELAVARAHSGEGEKYALYETTLADLYLLKAREEQGHAHYSDAEDLGESSRKFADEAVHKAAERRTSSAATVPVPTATIQHPTTGAPPKVTVTKPDHAPIPIEPEATPGKPVTPSAPSPNVTPPGSTTPNNAPATGAAPAVAPPPATAPTATPPKPEDKH